MQVSWKAWEGQVVDLSFPLRRYLGGTDQRAVFLTQYGDPEPVDAAIKLVVATPETSEEISHWDRAAQLSHPNLLRLLHSGTCQANHVSVNYVVTEYADENLGGVLAERPLTAEEAREMLQPLVDALAYIHGEGLVHGHLKPSNILAVGDQLKLAVDGVTTVGELNPARTEPGPYDPPEFSESGCSPVGDIWSFGMTLVEALTQKLPRQTDPREEPVLPPGLPPEFLPIVRACLNPDPRKRAALSDIRAQLRGEPQPVLPPPVVREPEPPAPRTRRGLVLVGVGAVALAAVLAAPRIFHQPAPEQPATSVDVISKPAAAVPATAPPVTPAPVTAAPVAAPTPEPAPEPPHAPPARSRGAEAQSGQVVQQVMPDVTDQARRTIHGKVKISVRANVDSTGHVSDAKLESKNSRYFGNLALKAAEEWKFEPSSSEGPWLLRFEFTNKGTDVRASKASR